MKKCKCGSEKFIIDLDWGYDSIICSGCGKTQKYASRAEMLNVKGFEVKDLGDEIHFVLVKNNHEFISYNKEHKSFDFTLYKRILSLEDLSLMKQLCEGE